jgi:Spy/CpxP family protein refolding chaperone
LHAKNNGFAARVITAQKPQSSGGFMKRIIVVSAVLVLAFASGLFAQGMGKGCPEMDMGMGMMGCGMEMGGGAKMILAMASELNLTADQMDKLKKIMDTAPEKGADKDEMQADRNAMKEEMQKDKSDQAKINALIDKMAEKHKAVIKIKLEHKAAVDAILTKEQKEILKKKMEEKKAKMQDKKGECKKKLEK